MKNRFAILATLAVLLPLAIGLAKLEGSQKLTKPTPLTYSSDFGDTYILPTSDSDYVVISLIVHAGTNDSSSPLDGVPHYLEHILWQRNNSSNPASVILPAYTNEQSTRYEVLTSVYNYKNELERLKRLFAPLENIGVEEIELQRENIIQEFFGDPNNELLDGPTKYSIREFLLEGMQNTRSVIGTPEEIANISLADLEQFHQKYYVSDFMSLVISGDVETTVLKDVIGLREVKPTFTQSRKSFTSSTISPASKTQRFASTSSSWKGLVFRMTGTAGNCSAIVSCDAQNAFASIILGAAAKILAEEANEELDAVEPWPFEHEFDVNDEGLAALSFSINTNNETLLNAIVQNDISLLEEKAKVLVNAESIKNIRQVLIKQTLAVEVDFRDVHSFYVGQLLKRPEAVYSTSDFVESLNSVDAETLTSTISAFFQANRIFVALVI